MLKFIQVHDKTNRISTKWEKNLGEKKKEKLEKMKNWKKNHLREKVSAVCSHRVIPINLKKNGVQKSVVEARKNMLNYKASK